MASKLYVCISLDVEEEGLFSGKYASREVSVKNVPLIKRLASLNLPLTLFCAYSVFLDQEAGEAALWMRDHCGAEIGGHLHHWSTPPYTGEFSGQPVRTHLLPPELLAGRLDSLLAAGEKLAGAPLTSFRMGRWDLKKALFPLLAARGIRVDSSICPLRAFKNGPDHFLAPAAPYWINTDYGRILEAPLTQIPISRPLARAWHNLWRGHPAILDSFHFFGALSCNPVWHSLPVMRAAARLQAKSAFPLLCLFWHSSELMPGGSPNIPDQAAADRLFEKIRVFCEWLGKNFALEGITASQIPGLPFAASFPARSVAGAEDW